MAKKKRPRMVKRCIICGAKFNPSGKQLTCSEECSWQRRQDTAKAWKAENLEHYYEVTRDSQYARHKEWREENPEKMRVKSREDAGKRRAADPKKVRKEARIYRATNLDRLRKYDRERYRRAKLKAKAKAKPKKPKP